MNNDKEMPQVHAFTSVPRNLVAAARESIAEQKEESKYIHDEKAVAVYKPEEETDLADEDEKYPNFDSDDEDESNWFENETTRIGFIQKVLAVKLLQLLGMIAVICFLIWNARVIFEKHISTKLAVLSIFGLFLNNIVTFGVVFGRNTEEARSKNPFRYMFLVVYPLRSAAVLLICGVASGFTTTVVLIFVDYCIVVIALLIYSIFACQTNLGFVTKHGITIATCTQIALCAVTIPFLTWNYYYDPVKTSSITCVPLFMVLEYVYILNDIEAMTSKGYWRKTPTDFLDGAINLQMDYYHILRDLVLKISKESIMFKRIDEAIEKV